MGRRVSTLTSFSFLVLVSATAVAQTHPKLAELTGVGDYVHVDGVWIADVRTKETKLVPAVYDYTCYRHGTEFVGTNAFCLEVTAGLILASAFAPHVLELSSIGGHPLRDDAGS